MRNRSRHTIPAAVATQLPSARRSSIELMPPPPGGTNEFRPAPPAGAKHPVPPIVAALDANGDGELDSTEISNASAALLQLDVNGDGQLTREELRPRGHGGPGGAGGPPEGGGSGGPQGLTAPASRPLSKCSQLGEQRPCSPGEPM